MKILCINQLMKELKKIKLRINPQGFSLIVNLCSNHYPAKLLGNRKISKTSKKSVKSKSQNNKSMMMIINLLSLFLRLQNIKVI